MKKTMRRSFMSKGFTAIELLMSLIIISGIIISIVHLTHKELEVTKGYMVAENATDYARQSLEFLKTHYSTLADVLTANDGTSNNLVITIPPQILRDDGFLATNYPDMNKLKQYPCLVVTYGDNQLEAFLYYRSDENNETLNSRQLHAGLEHVGGMIGLYSDGSISGAGKTWSLDANQTHHLFLREGTVTPDIGLDKDKFRCNGSQIANNSFVINYASLLILKNRLPKDDVLSQYPDPRAPIGDLDNDNTMNGDLNMDYKHEQNAIVFQMNPDCVMNPKVTATMQDYDPNNDVTGKVNKKVPNTRGCKNRQLSIRNGTDVNGNSEMVVTGFQQGGDEATYESYNRDISHLPIQRPFVGELKAQSFQATTEIAVGTKCDAIDIGAMARQTKTKDLHDVNNLWVSQVICMKNPLCSVDTDGVCYMPANSVTIKYDIPINTVNPVTSAACPVGTALVASTDNHEDDPDHSACCGFGCGWTDDMHDHIWDGITYSYLSNTGTNISRFKQGITIGIVHYKHTCPAQCSCDSGDAWLWQPSLTSITCSNDINRVPIEYKQ